jgi:hypothetical protein
MKNYKYFVSIFLATIIVPSITFASWWNPFSWSIFHRTDTKTQILENKILELENKLNSISTTTSTSTLTSTTTNKTEIKTQLVDTKKQTANSDTSNLNNIINLGVTSSTSISTQTNSKYINPATGQYYTPKEYADSVAQKLCLSNPTLFGCPNGPKEADLEYCRDQLGSHSTVMNRKDSTGTWGCICEEGYKAKVTSTTIGQCEKMDYFDYDTYGVFDDGVVYSPEQRAQIECAYYGIGCPTIDVRIINR